MNRLYFSTVNVIVLLSACLSYAGDSNLVNPYLLSYPFKSAVIHYGIKNEYGHGKTSTGTEVVYIKGDNLAKVTKMTVPDLKNRGKTKNTETLQISDPDYLYNIDLVKKTGTKIDNPRKYTMPAYDKLSYEEKKAFYGRMSKRGIISLNLVSLGKKTGTDTVLGRQCDVYESGEKLTPEKLREAVENGENPIYMKSWVWRTAVILKVIMSGFGWSNEMVATKIEENVKIPDSQFTVPSDIKVAYDEEKSEFAKKEALASFEIYRTGKPMVVKVKLKKEEIKPNKEDSKTTVSNQKSQENQR
ncbi:MAG: hypothetical protein ACM3SR_11555 [Ignavibacteriales bacterium]